MRTAAGGGGDDAGRRFSVLEYLAALTERCAGILGPELNTGARMDFRATYAGQDRRPEDGTFWYAIDRSILAERGRAIHGPPAAQIFRSVSESALVDLLIASLRWHLGLADDHTDPAVADAVGGPSWTVDAVLNACRGWQRVHSGYWSSKVAAGEAVLAERPDPAVGGSSRHRAGRGLDLAAVRQALDARGGAAPPPVSQARRFQRQVLESLESSAAPDH